MTKEIRPLNNSFLRTWEIRITEKLCNFVPPFVGTKILTFLSLASSIMILLSYYLAVKMRFFLFFCSFFVITQWIFDCLDGTIGRLRKEGFAGWGFYMDHLFDYFFMSAVIFGFWFLLPHPQVFVLFFLSSSFMVAFFLMHGATKDKKHIFETSFGRLSPIEFRLLIIFLNIFFYFFEAVMRPFVCSYLFYFNIILFIMLIAVIYSCQKRLSAQDIAEKNSYIK